MAAKTSKRTVTDLAFLCRALKVPAMAASIERLAARARDESWTHEEFLAACLEREVASRQAHGGDARIRLHAGQPRRLPTTTRIRSYRLATAA